MSSNVSGHSDQATQAAVHCTNECQKANGHQLYKFFFSSSVHTVFDDSVVERFLNILMYIQIVWGFKLGDSNLEISNQYICDLLAVSPRITL